MEALCPEFVFETIMPFLSHKELKAVCRVRREWTPFFVRAYARLVAALCPPTWSLGDLVYADLKRVHEAVLLWKELEPVPGAWVYPKDVPDSTSSVKATILHLAVESSKSTCHGPIFRTNMVVANIVLALLCAEDSKPYDNMVDRMILRLYKQGLDFTKITKPEQAATFAWIERLPGILHRILGIKRPQYLHDDVVSLISYRIWFDLIAKIVDENVPLTNINTRFQYLRRMRKHMLSSEKTRDGKTNPESLIRNDITDLYKSTEYLETELRLEAYFKDDYRAYRAME